MPYRYCHQSLVMKQATVNQLNMLVCVWWNFLKTGKTCCYSKQKHGIFKAIFFPLCQQSYIYLIRCFGVKYCCLFLRVVPYLRERLPGLYCKHVFSVQKTVQRRCIFVLLSVDEFRCSWVTTGFRLYRYFNLSYQSFRLALLLWLNLKFIWNSWLKTSIRYLRSNRSNRAFWELSKAKFVEIWLL